MEKFNLIATTTFGLEAICKNELKNLGYEIINTENGRVYFEGSLRDVAICNLWLRSADRVLIELGRFEALSFEELFDNVYKINWQDILPENGNFIINGKSIKSRLFSISDCQRITEKAIVEKLKTKYKTSWFKKDGPLYNIEVSLLNDVASITIDTSGAGLHKRGYRKLHGEAPLKETLAASLVLLSYWNEDRMLYDPFSGTGTILIEAAMIGKNIAPGLERGFNFNDWTGVDKNILKDEKEKAKASIKNLDLSIRGSEIDRDTYRLSKGIIDDLGFSKDIIIKNEDFRNSKAINNNYEVIITNPPYGERLKDADVKKLEVDLFNKYKKFDTLSEYILTSDENLERNINKKADRKRKLYNGRIKVNYYQFYGPRPPQK